MKKTENEAVAEKKVTANAKDEKMVITEREVVDYVNNRLLSEITKETSAQKWDEKPLTEDKVYHLNMMGGLPLYWILSNRRSFRRARKMFDACQENGMTTPAIIVPAKIVSDWNLIVVDPATMSTISPEALHKGYCVMEGHGRLFAHLIGLTLKSKIQSLDIFDFRFILQNYTSPEEFGKAYLSTNLDMTRTSNKDRLNIAEARCQNPLVKECLRKMKEDSAIAKASYYWTYGRELQPEEIKRLINNDTDAPSFSPDITEALQSVYEAFKKKFSSKGAEKIYRGVPAAQWAADKLKDNSSVKSVAQEICQKLEEMSIPIYTAIITAQTNSKKHLTRDCIIKNNLDKMMEP